MKRTAATLALFALSCGASHGVAPAAEPVTAAEAPRRASPRAPRDPVSVAATATSIETSDGEAGEIVVTLAVADAFHLMSNHPSRPEYIATNVTVDPRSAPDLAFSEPAYPNARSFAFDGETLSVFEGTVVVHVPFEAKSSAAPGTRHVRGVVRYQACTAGRCLAPKNVRFATTVDAPR